MEKRTDSRYDDDLTVGVDDFESDAIDTDYVDLFEFSGGDESPISRLKTIMLEIDWEITDEVLTQFNEELIDLKDIWSDDPIKLVYVQILEKISKYIYQEKSYAHPSAIRLLMSYYYNLEKIEIDTELDEEEKKSILKDDLKKFEKLKNHITQSSPSQAQAEAAGPKKEVLPAVEVSEKGDIAPSLFNLKACILGMDWEITDRELSDLSQEIKRLETEFAGQKTRLLFLQGMASLGGYIKLKKSDSHADAFKILYSFFEGLEKIVSSDLSLEEEKAILFPEVEKFHKFKELIAPTITAQAISERQREEQTDDYSTEPDSSVAPAFAGIEGEDVHGFQAEAEVADLGDDAPEAVLGQIDTFFTGDSAAEGTSDAETSAPVVSTEEALRGVDVETEADDDSDEEALPTRSDGVLAPALAGEEEEQGFSAELTREEIVVEAGGETSEEIEDRLSGFFDEDTAQNRRVTDRAAALEGVDVETETGGVDPEPESLVEPDDRVAPALADTEEDHGWRDDDAPAPAGDGAAEDGAPLAGVDVETEADDDSDLEALPTEPDGVLAPALSDTAEGEELTSVYTADELSEDGDGDSIADIEARLSQFFDVDVPDESEQEITPPSADSSDEPEEILTLDADSPAEEPEFEAFTEDDTAGLFADDEPADTVTAADDEVLETAGSERFEEEADAPVELAEESGIETELGSFFDDMQESPAEEGAEGLFDEPEEPDAPVELAEESGIETELDSFFDDMQESPAEEGAEGLFDEPEEPGSTPAAVADDEMDETVIFEAVEDSEDERASLGDIPVATLVDEEPGAPGEESYVTFDSEADEMEFFAEIDEKVDEPGEFKQEILEEFDRLEPETPGLPDEPAAEEENHLAFELESDESTLFETDEEAETPMESAPPDDEFVFTSGDPLSDLRASIASLSVEINESIVEGILSDASSLRSHFMDRPVEKTLLQLISTIVQHIGHYGYESSAEAHGLLLSVFDKLDQIQTPETDTLQAQEGLLEETSKVLLWQQKMLDRQAIRKGDKLTFLDPLRSEESEADDGAGISLETDAGDEPVLALDEFDDLENEADQYRPHVEPGEDEALQVDAGHDSATELDPAAADFIKRELASLKDSLLSEIDDLRSRLADRK